MRRRAILVAVLGALALGGCSFSADTKAAEGGVADFHAKLNAGQLAQIYAGSGPEMKSTTSEAALEQLLSAVHRKLGAYQSGKSVGWNDNVTPGGHFVTLNYASTYARGQADERFVYRIAGASAALVGYNITSNALIVN